MTTANGRFRRFSAFTTPKVALNAGMAATVASVATPYIERLARLSLELSPITRASISEAATEATVTLKILTFYSTPLYSPHSREPGDAWTVQPQCPCPFAFPFEGAIRATRAGRGYADRLRAPVPWNRVGCVEPQPSPLSAPASSQTVAPARRSIFPGARAGLRSLSRLGQGPSPPSRDQVNT